MANLEDVEALKAKGNALFSEEKWKAAQETYTEAVEMGTSLGVDARLLAALLSNRSVSWAMMEDYEAALVDAERVVALRPGWARGYVRKAVALIGKNRIAEAADVVAEGQGVDEADPMLRDLAHQISELRKDDGRALLKRKAPEESSFSEALAQIRAAGVTRAVDVVVLSGFLGAGKTTLLTRVLSEIEGNKRIAVVVNDMAEINVDADLIQQRHSFSEVSEELVELTNGCVCCTLRGDLIKEATRLLCMKCFDVILIEATGISEPMPVAATFLSEDFHGQSLKDYFKLDNMVTLVDGSQFLEELEKGQRLKDRKLEAHAEDTRSITQLLIDQVEFADTLVINKCDLISKDTLERTKRLLKQLNSTAVLLSCTHAQVDRKEILDTGRFQPERVKGFEGFETELITPHTSETEEYGIGSFVFSSPLPFHPLRLHQLIFGASQGDSGDETQVSEASVLKSVFRSKGFFYLASALDVKLTWSTAGRSVQFEMAERWLASMLPEHLWTAQHLKWHPTFGDREQKLVVIADSSHLPQIQSALQSCLLTSNELQTSQQEWRHMDPSHLWALEAASDEEVEILESSPP